MVIIGGQDYKRNFNLGIIARTKTRKQMISQGVAGVNIFENNRIVSYESYMGEN